VEPLSLDEAFLDVTHNKPGIASATRIARQIRQQIFQATGGLTASAGVSFNKFLAKVASDVHKPDGITVITPRQAPAFIDQLPIRRFFGVGKATEEKMRSLGIKTGADLKNVSLQWLIDRFGRAGHYFFNIAHGRDRRPVQPDRQRKSYGKEITLKADIDDTNEMMAILDGLARRVLDGMQRVDHQGLTLTLKIKYADFRSVTRSVTFTEPISDMAAVMDHLTQLLAHTDAGAKKVRLLGVSVSNFVGAREPGRGWVQLPLPLHF
jgi:DNA polymerase-4